jgi:hypothetical protein
MSSEIQLSQFLYDNPTSTSTSYTPLHNFGLEFQYDPTSVNQTFYNYAQWYKHNDDNIGRLPEPFFSDFISIITARAFGMDLEKDDMESIDLQKLEIKED